MRLCPRIRYHKDGTASLHGIPRADLHSLLVSARLHHYDEEAKREKKNKTESIDNLMWYKRQEIIIDLANKLDDAPRMAEYTYTMRPLHTLTPWQIQRRIDDAKSQAAFRKKFDEIIANLRVDKTPASC